MEAWFAVSALSCLGACLRAAQPCPGTSAAYNRTVLIFLSGKGMPNIWVRLTLFIGAGFLALMKCCKVKIPFFESLPCNLQATPIIYNDHYPLRVYSALAVRKGCVGIDCFTSPVFWPVSFLSFIFGLSFILSHINVIIVSL